MQGIFSRLAWFAAIAVVLSYGAYTVAGSIVNAQASGAGDPVLIRDELQGGEHQLSGMVMVPTPCDELSVKTRTLSPASYAIIFETWREPSVTCGKEPTPRAFRTILFAPATGVYFMATLDGVSLPIAVVPILVNRPH